MALKENEFYCVKCRKSVSAKKQNMCLKKKKNPRNGMNVFMLKSKCKCGTNLTKFVSPCNASKLENKYGKC